MSAFFLHTLYKDKISTRTKTYVGSYFFFFPTPKSYNVLYHIGSGHIIDIFLYFKNLKTCSIVKYMHFKDKNTLTTGRWLLDNLPLVSGGVRLSEWCLVGVLDPGVEEVGLWVWMEWGWTVVSVTEVGRVMLEKLPQLKETKLSFFYN